MDTGIFFGFLLVVILLFCLTALAKGARTVKQYEKGLITRLGKYHGMAPSGLTFIIPFIDDIMRVDMREQVITVPPQKLITKDNVTVEVDAVVYYKVIDPVKSQFEVQDFGYACTTLAQTNLRNLIGDRTLDETLVARDMINSNLRHVLDEATNNWGVKATRVEVQKIEPPRANAEAEAIKMVSTAAETYFKERAETMRRLEVLNNTLAQNTKYIVPSNSSLVNVLGLDSAVQALPKATQGPSAPPASGPAGR